MDRAQCPEAGVLVDNSISFHRDSRLNRSITRVSNSRYTEEMSLLCALYGYMRVLRSRFWNEVHGYGIK